MDETLRVGRELSEIQRVRAWMAGILSASPVAPEQAADVLLMASELVTNVLRHTDSEPLVMVRIGSADVFVEVSDTDPAPPTRRSAQTDLLSPGGWGLHVVQLLSSAWGVQHHGAVGKTIWFRVHRRP